MPSLVLLGSSCVALLIVLEKLVMIVFLCQEFCARSPFAWNLGVVLSHPCLLGG